ncbi:MAG: hypothetical protein JSV42_05470 [Chloroflexota bacterium]|nr:MAG: hypothetical protein JSV42_05470 [Chloroflexota bacterium]
MKRILSEKPASTRSAFHFLWVQESQIFLIAREISVPLVILVAEGET